MKKRAQALKLSQKIFQQSQDILVGGVNSPVRAFGAVGGIPRVIKKAKGAMIYDEDGNSYIDYINSWGALILGHAHPKVVNAICNTSKSGTSFGAPTHVEYSLAREIQKVFPSMEKLRFVSSGTEATQSAIRLARGFTGRNKIVKFEGCYHGHSDSLLVKAGSGALTFGIPSSLGVPQNFSKETIVLPFNHVGALEETFLTAGNEIAAVIIEPIAANMGVVLPKKGYLEKIREITARHQSLLIFDEIITGFRISRGGVQQYYSIKPDITCLGKIIGGGLPVGAYGGKREIMELISPLGGVYQAGTLSGNPVTMAAGLATLKELSRTNVYKKIYEKTEFFCTRLEKIIQRNNMEARLTWTTGMFTLFVDHYPTFFHALLEEGIYFPPSQFEACFISWAHTKKQLDLTLSVIERYFEGRQ